MKRREVGLLEFHDNRRIVSGRDRLEGDTLEEASAPKGSRSGLSEVAQTQHPVKGKLDILRR